MIKEEKSTHTNLASKTSPYADVPLGLKSRRIVKTTIIAVLLLSVSFAYYTLIEHIKNINVDISGVAPIPVDLGKAIYGGDFLTQGYESLRFLSVDIESPQWDNEFDNEFVLSASPLDDNGNPIPGAQSTEIALSVNGDPYIMSDLTAQYYAISVVSAPLSASAYTYPSYSIVPISTGMNCLDIKLNSSADPFSSTPLSGYEYK